MIQEFPADEQRKMLERIVPDLNGFGLKGLSKENAEFMRKTYDFLAQNAKQRTKKNFTAETPSF